MKFLFTSDPHGNLRQYASLISLANAMHDVHHVIIGGDLFPKRKAKESQHTKTAASQLYFFENCLLPLLQQLEPPRQCFLTLGNADFVCNVGPFQSILDRLEKNSGTRRVHLVVNGCIQLDNNVSLLCYSCVPMTRHRLKDWERYDTHDIDELVARSHGYIGFKGYTTMDETALDQLMMGWEWRSRGNSQTTPYGREARRIQLPSEQNRNEEAQSAIERYSIETDLGQIVSSAYIDREERRWLWVTHGPPYDTVADVCKVGHHVGSVAIRRLVEQYAPVAILSGHIHETVEMSNGRYKERLETCGTWVMCSGNYPNIDQVAVLLIDIDHPERTERKLV